jgi:hypothetical protein
MIPIIASPSSASFSTFITESNLLQLQQRFKEKLNQAPWCDLDLPLPLDLPLAFQAAFIGEVSTLEKIPPESFCSYAKCDWEIHLLHLAALGGDLKTFQWLCNWSANLLPHDRDNNTPFEYAVIGHSVEILIYLLTSKADLHTESPHLVSQGHSTSEPPYIRGVRFALAYDSCDLLDILLQYSPTPEGHYSKAIVCCADAGKLQLISYYREKGIKRFQKDLLKEVLLHSLYGASRNGHLEMLKFLLNQGEIGQEELKKCLYEAAQYDQAEIARYLVKEKDLDLLAPIFINNFPWASSLEAAMGSRSFKIFELAKELKLNLWKETQLEEMRIPLLQVMHPNRFWWGMILRLNKQPFCEVYTEAYLIKQNHKSYGDYLRPPANTICLNALKIKPFGPEADIALVSTIISHQHELFLSDKMEARKNNYIDQMLLFLINSDQHFSLSSFLKKHLTETKEHLSRSLYYCIRLLRPNSFMIASDAGKEETNILLKKPFGLFLLQQVLQSTTLHIPYSQNHSLADWPQRRELLVAHLLSTISLSHSQDKMESFAYQFTGLIRYNNELLIDFLRMVTSNYHLNSVFIPSESDISKLALTEAACNHRIAQRLMAIGYGINEEAYRELVIITPSEKYFSAHPQEFAPTQFGYMRHQAFLQLLDNCYKNPTMMKKEGRKLLGAPKLYAFTILHRDGYLKLIDSIPQEEDLMLRAQRFFQITSQLPDDLKALMANRYIGSSRDYLTQDELAPTLKEYLAKSSPSQKGSST